MPTLKAGTLLINPKTQLIGLVYRTHKNDYSFPKGHLEEGETLAECAVRETEEETLRANHLLSEKEIQIQTYTTPQGEDCETHMYLSLDDGPTTKEIPMQDREQLRWTSPDEIESLLTYDDLKELWRLAKPTILKLFEEN